METHFKFYDKRKIGKLIAWGGDNFVYEYDDGQVIKFSIFSWMLGKHSQAKVLRDYKICKQFFGDYILETEVVSSKNGRRIALVQPKITGRYLLEKDLADDFIYRQFQEITAVYQLLIKAGYAPIDLVGGRGAIMNRLSNIFVTPKKKLVIIDAMLVEFEGAGIFSPIFFLLQAAFNWRQGKLLKRFVLFRKNGS